MLPSLTKFKMKNNYFFSFLILALISCSKPQNQNNITSISLGGKGISNLSEIVESIDYLLLDFPKSHYMERPEKVFITDSVMILTDHTNTMNFLVYDLKGKLLSEFSFYGEGPGKTTSIIDVAFNPFENLLEVLSINKIMKFDLTGDFIEEESLPFQPNLFLSLNNNEKALFFPYYASPNLESLKNKKGTFHFYNNENDILSEKIFDLPSTPSWIEKNAMVSSSSRTDIFFSLTMLDTIYWTKNKSIHQKIYLDFESHQLPFDMVSPYVDDANGLVSLMNREDFINKYRYHIPTLHYDNGLISSRFKSGLFYGHFIYHLTSGKTILIDKFVNDIDNGMEKFLIKNLKDNIIYSFYQPDEFMSKLRNESDQFKGMNNNFTKVAKQLDSDDFLVLAKYKLRKF